MDVVAVGGGREGSSESKSDSKLVNESIRSPEQGVVRAREQSPYAVECWEILQYMLQPSGYLL